MKNYKKQKLEILIKQYELFSTYATSTSPGIRYNILSIGLATMGVIFAGVALILKTDKISISGITCGGKELLAGIMLTLIIPAFCLAILFMWLGEEHRMIRMGKFLKKLEEQINSELQEEIMTWEKYIRQKSQQIRYPEVFILALFLGSSFLSSLGGIFIMKYFLLPLIIKLLIVADFVYHFILISYILSIIRKFN